MTAAARPGVRLLDIKDRIRVNDPEFLISGLRPKTHTPGLTRMFGGRLVYYGYTQIFRYAAPTLAEATLRVCRDVNWALTHGVRMMIEGLAVHRTMGGRDFWEKVSGETIEDRRLRLVVLREFEARYKQDVAPTSEQIDAARELGLPVDHFLRLDRGHFEVSCEVGLDITPG